jgi:hypothetical protein
LEEREMTLIDLHNYLKGIVEGGVVNPNMPVKFRGDGGKLYSIDYSVMDNEGKSILFVEDWF